MCTHVCTRVLPCAHICARMRSHLQACAHAHIPVHTCAHTGTHVCMHVSTHVRMSVDVQAHMCAWICCYCSGTATPKGPGWVLFVLCWDLWDLWRSHWETGGPKRGTNWEIVRLGGGDSQTQSLSKPGGAMFGCYWLLVEAFNFFGRLLQLSFSFVLGHLRCNLKAKGQARSFLIATTKASAAELSYG